LAQLFEGPQSDIRRVEADADDLPAVLRFSVVTVSATIAGSQPASG
jgi:hypothetical protein